MTPRSRILPLLLVALLCAWSGPALSEDAKIAKYLDGHWQGVLKVAAVDAMPAYDFTLRLDIEDGKAEVQTLEANGKWNRIMPGQFKLYTNNFNAVVVGMHRSVGDCWDETWVFNVALDTSNQLRTHWSRMVDNIRCLKADAETFSRWADGTLNVDATAK